MPVGCVQGGPGAFGSCSYHTADSQSKLDLIMSPGQKERFTHTLMYDFDKIMAILSHIDIAAAETRKLEDKQMIMDKVANGPGIKALNNVIAGLLREWLLRTVRAAVETYTGDEAGKALLLNNAARMLTDQARTVELHDAAVFTTASITPSPCLLYTSPSPRDGLLSRMPSSA